MTPCAKDCPRRTATCHSTCGDYKIWKAKREKQSEEIHKIKLVRYALRDTECKRTKRMKDDKRRQGRMR